MAFPYFRAGLLGLGRKTLVQPVAVEDVARAFAEAIERPAASGRTYDLAGPKRYTWPEFYAELAAREGFKARPAVPVPVWYAEALTAVVPAGMLPFNRSQVQMAAEDNVGDPAPFVRDFGWTPRAFG